MDNPIRLPAGGVVTSQHTYFLPQVLFVCIATYRVDGREPFFLPDLTIVLGRRVADLVCREERVLIRTVVVDQAV